MARMNLYHRKQRWKLALLGAALLMFFASIWFSYQIVNKVQEKELDRVQQWADAVKRKSELVNLTNRTFNELSATLTKLQERDRQKVQMWSLAMNEVNKPLDDYSFVMRIITENNGIPMILTDQAENIVKDYNLEALDVRIKGEIELTHGNAKQTLKDSLFNLAKADSLAHYLSFWRENRQPIEIDLFEGAKQKVFYFDSIYYQSQKLIELQKSRDSLTQAFTNELIQNDNLVPVMFIDKSSGEVIATNISEYDSTNTDEIIASLAAKNDPIAVRLGAENEGIIYFEYSPEVTQMKYFPFVQFFIIGLFVLIAYLVFSTFRKAEQDQVWVGMAKETAHQLGTPISSLMAWNQLLEAKGIEKDITDEINKDIERLNTVTNRFSKIGSEAILNEEDITDILDGVVQYLRKRISSKISLNYTAEGDELITAMVNRSLIEWVIENITKNAVDAMDGSGRIDIVVRQVEDQVQIDIADDGKGIAANKLKAVFQPGYTTKTRGWGLGLSLVKRIVEDFHKGKVYVLRSEVGKGTTFRITLKV